MRARLDPGRRDPAASAEHRAAQQYVRHHPRNTGPAATRSSSSTAAPVDRDQRKDKGDGNQRKDKDRDKDRDKHEKHDNRHG
jgi:hypothetical protein